MNNTQFPERCQPLPQGRLRAALWSQPAPEPGRHLIPRLWGSHGHRALWLKTAGHPLLCLPKAVSQVALRCFKENEVFSIQALRAAASYSLMQLFTSVLNSGPWCRGKNSQPAQKSRLFLPNRETGDTPLNPPGHRLFIHNTRTLLPLILPCITDSLTPR